MTDLSALPADELAEKVREYLMRKVRYRDDDKDLIDGYEDPGGDALSELRDRASERDQAVRALEQIEAYLADKTADEVEASVVYKIARDARASSQTERTI